ncbi:MAG: hypothetical protein JNK48_21185 [Bryobacterales bacterium]|nr:hypothetical protein [Bryobacterales bacterium]
MKAVLACMLVALPAAAQLEVFTVRGTEERPVSGLVALGETATGEALQAVIRIRNTSDLLATITTLSLSGTGFTLESAPSLPKSILGKFSIDFYVRFLSESAVTDARAALRINTITITFSAAAVAAPTLYLLETDGSRTKRTAGVPSIFANTERGLRSSRTFLLDNPHDTAVRAGAIAVAGDSFLWNELLAGPMDLPPRSSRRIEIVFQPATSGLKTGALTIDARRYPLEGVATEPAPPRPSISVSEETLKSGKQVRVAIRLESVSRANTTGRLRLEFTPAVSGPEDPGILFPATNSRTIAFVVREGEPVGLFSGSRDTVLQTGTTAGKLRLIADTGGYTAEATYTIDPAPVVAETVTVKRGIEIMEVLIKGFDNSRTPEQVSFRFFNRDGVEVPPGILTSLIADKFRTYYQTTTVGGMFQMLAVFPASTTTISIAAAEVEFRNGYGISRTERLSF